MKNINISAISKQRSGVNFLILPVQTKWSYRRQSKKKLDETTRFKYACGLLQLNGKIFAVKQMA